jgi:hypothetical protein
MSKNFIMDLSKVTLLALIPPAALLLHLQCTDATDDYAMFCDCQSASVDEEKKDVEAVVVLIGGNQDEDKFAISTHPRDFETTTHTVGQNILVPCDLLPAAYRKPGLRIWVSYKRKDCYGAVSSPSLRNPYGYYIDLTSIKSKL